LCVCVCENSFIIPTSLQVGEISTKNPRMGI
jgi:hypothetical protein